MALMGEINEVESSFAGVLEAQTHLWNLTFSFINSMCLKSAIQLGIPDIIHQHGRPISLSELLASLPSVSPAKSNWLHRLLRLLVHSGVLAKTKANCKHSGILEADDKEAEQEELYDLTPSSSLLVKEKFNNLSPFVLMMLDPALVNPWQFLSASFQQQQPEVVGDNIDEILEPFKMAHGVSLWESSRELSNSFNEAMASDSRFIMNIVVSNCGEVFQGLRSLVDVGGGKGDTARTIAKSFPHVKCTVYDLPHVVATVPAESYDVVDYVGGDMFEFIPQADALFFKWILHDWSDEDCVKILRRCKEVIPSKEKGGKVIILDMVVNGGMGHHKSVETQLFFDMLMMVLVKGKERNEREWRKIFLDAGFTSYVIKPVLGVRSIIEVYP